MRLSQFLLLVTLTCIACNSIVASSKGLIQVKTLDATSQRELTDGTRRKLREGAVKDDIADGEERAISFEHLGAELDRMVPKVNNFIKDKFNYFMKILKRFYKELKRLYAKLFHKKPQAKPNGFPAPVPPPKYLEKQHEAGTIPAGTQTKSQNEAATNDDVPLSSSVPTSATSKETATITTSHNVGKSDEHQPADVTYHIA